MVYLKPLYSTDSIDLQSIFYGSPAGTCENNICQNVIIFIKKIGTEKYWVYLIVQHPCRTKNIGAYCFLKHVE